MVENIRKYIVLILAIVAFFLLIYNIVQPSHLNQRLEMQHCGGCHSEESTIRMHEYADPLDKPCGDCHTDAATGLSVHAEMIPSECGRCHQFGDEPAFKDCNLCHGQHYHIKGGIDTGDQECITCHQSHSLLTDSSCSRCHSEEYETLKASGDKHSQRPDSCYSCHVEHRAVPNCLDCHEEGTFHGVTSLNCTDCHQPHMPKALYFSPVVGNQECGTCHPDVLQYFEDHPSEHSGVNCTDCHQQHQSRPDCQNCHENVHPEFAEYDMDRCIACHRDPHSPLKYGFEREE